MKLEYTEGCVCTSLLVDGVETVDMEEKDLKDVICKMIGHIDDVAILQQVWMKIMESMGEYKDLGHCECCGDFISEYTWEIND